MVFDSDMFQLLWRLRQLAQLIEPSLATMGVVTHPGGGTAHEDQDDASALTQARLLVGGVLTRVSHTCLVEASPLALGRGLLTPARRLTEGLHVRRLETFGRRSGGVRRPAPSAEHGDQAARKIRRGPMAMDQLGGVDC
jgi:hypothetical protein